MMSGFSKPALGTMAALALLAGAALAQPAAPAASASTPAYTAGDGRQGTFKTVRGTVTRVHEGAGSPAAVGDPVWVGDRVLSGPKSAAALTLLDGTVLSLGPDSSVDLAQFDFDPTTQEGNVLIALAKGSLRLVTGLIAKLRPEQVKVTTPTTVIGVRGTDFIVEQN